MKLSTEMRKELDALKNTIVVYQKEGKTAEAHAKLGELTELRNKIEVQEELERVEAENFTGTPVAPKAKPNHTVAFNKALLGKPMTDAEMALAETGQIEHVGEQGGYLVPEDQRTQIEELKRELTPLKAYCNVIPVGTLAGSMPLEVGADDELVNFDELEEITQSDIRFGQVKWKLTDYGDLIPISNTLLQDETANLTNFIGRRFAKKAVRTENTNIIAQLKTATKKTGTGYKDIITMLNKELDPAISATAIIITNQDGFDYLDNLVDGNGRPLLTESLADKTKKLFKGREVVALSNAVLKSTGVKLTFFVGDMEEFLAFFDRGAYEMAVSKEAGFTKNATFMRVIERFDTQKVDTGAMIHLELTIPAE
ncbi:MAG TPA: phage major capsid protein [Epulopiscium sp.]|nr:phage major capsid protein [Candidatus Epulonipiscium sp.]